MEEQLDSMVVEQQGRKALHHSEYSVSASLLQISRHIDPATVVSLSAVSNLDPNRKFFRPWELLIPSTL